MEVPDIEILGSGDLFFCLRKEKTSRSAAAPKQWIWPASSCPDLLCAVSWWLEMRRAVGVDVSSKMWQLPWEFGNFDRDALVSMFSRCLLSLGSAPPAGFRWTLHCVRAGAASEANALDIAMSKIRRQGGWSQKSTTPERVYIDPLCPPSPAGRRFFGWLMASAM